MKKQFLTDVQEIQKRTREQIRKGAFVRSYSGDLHNALKVLNEALATEIVCTLRYSAHAYAVKGPFSENLRQMFVEHAREEARHARKIAERIQQLGGHANFSPEGLVKRSHATFEEGFTAEALIEEDLVAEQVAIDIYREMAKYFGDDDPVTRNLLESILADEEEHAEELRAYLHTISLEQKAA